jgi:hypothetical protein
MPAVSSKRKTKADLFHLRSLSAIEPATSTGRVLWIWPEIEASLSTGKKLRKVWEAACADGIDIPYPQFRVYVSRIRSRIGNNYSHLGRAPCSLRRRHQFPHLRFQLTRSETCASSARKSSPPASNSIPSPFRNR